jgi:2'-5' RNA ligase
LEKTHTTALALVPPENIWEPIQEIRRRQDRQVRRWMPHLNLLYPFYARSRFDEVAEPLAAAVRDFASFEVRLSTFRYFRHRSGSYTLWLDPESGGELERLQARLFATAPDCDDVLRHGAFRPHLSVGQFRGGGGALSAFLGELQAAWRPLAFTASEVSLIWREAPPRDVFSVDRTIRLGSGIARPPLFG